MAIIYLRNQEIYNEKKINITESYNLFKEKKTEQERQIFLESFIGKSNSEERENEKAIFISHRSTYKYKAQQLAKIFDKNHFDVYLDIKDEELQKNVSQSSNVPEKFIESLLEYGINESDYFLLLMTNDYMKSNWIPREIDFAKKYYKDIRGFDHNYGGWHSFPKIVYSSLEEIKSDFIQVEKAKMKFCRF